jgi:regulator of sigma E protease
MMVGFDLASPRNFTLASAIVGSAKTMWSLTSGTVTGLFHALTSSKARGQLHSIVGITQVTEEAVTLGPTYGLVIIGVVSLILGVINLFPFLPLDGGHVLWSVAEQLRGARISTQAMWKFSSVGIVLLVFLVFSGISNDISRLSGS